MVVLFSVLSTKEEGRDEDTVSSKPRIREAKSRPIRNRLRMEKGN